MYDVRVAMFQAWLEGKSPERFHVYHIGELARDQRSDPTLATLADMARKASTGRFIGVSKCGHVRWEDIGTGEIDLVTRRDMGEIVHIAVRR